MCCRPDETIHLNQDFEQLLGENFGDIGLEMNKHIKQGFFTKESSGLSVILPIVMEVLGGFYQSHVLRSGNTRDIFFNVNA